MDDGLISDNIGLWNGENSEGEMNGQCRVQRHIAKMRERNKGEESSVMEHAPDNSFEKNVTGGAGLGKISVYG